MPLLTTPHGLPVGYALSRAKADERQVLLSILDEARWPPGGPADHHRGQELLRPRLRGRPGRRRHLPAAPARKGEPDRAGTPFFKPLRQVIESVNDTFKGQLDLERHGGHTPAGAMARVLQRILAQTAAIWHNDHTGQPVKRSLTAHDH